MRRRNLRNVPVVDEADRVVGCLRHKDIVDYLAELYPDQECRIIDGVRRDRYSFIIDPQPNVRPFSSKTAPRATMVEHGTMNIKNFLLVAFLVLFLVLVSGPAAQAQDQPVPEEGPAASEADVPGEEAEPAEEDQPAEPSKADRLLNLERMLERDREKLEELNEELERWQGFFKRLSVETIEIADLLDLSRMQLEELDPEADAEAVAEVTGRIARLEKELELFRTQSDLLLTAETTVRDQIMTMEENIALEEHAQDLIRGVAPARVDRAPAAVEAAPVTDTAQPGLPRLLPGIPAAPTTATPSERIEARLETPEQIRALRELEQTEAELALAEGEVVEFVGRRELLEKQIGFEEQLLQTARDSKVNLEKALSWRREELEALKAGEASGRAVRDLERTIGKIKAFIGDVGEELEARIEYLAELNLRHEKFGPEEEMLGRVVDDKRRTVQKARERLYWLQSPLHPRNLLQWARTRGPRILLALAATVVLLLLLRLIVRRTARLLVRSRRGARHRGTNRADTLAFSFRSAFSVLIMVGGMLLVLQEAGLDIKTVLGGAAILGVAIAFGAQNLMRDYFTGFLILIEDQYELGDLITIGAITGTVESVNMRITVLRDLEGRVHFIPNGEIKAVTNRTYGWGRAVVEVPVGFKEDVDRAMRVLTDVSKELSVDPQFGDWIEEDPVMLGVDKFTEFGVVIKFMLKTRPDKMFQVRRELLRRVKNRLDEEGIEISVPHRLVVSPPAEG